jgi:YVTN family beta-propeller protein
MIRTTLPLALAAAFALTACQTATSPVPNQAAGGESAKPALTAAKQIAVGKTPHGMGAAAGFVYNSNIGENTISVIDAATDAVVKTIPVENGTPGYVKAFHDGKTLLVTDTKQGKLMVFDPAQDHKLLQTIDVGPAPDKIRVDGDQVLVTLVGEAKAVLLTFEADRAKAPTRKDFAIGAANGEHRDGAFDAGWIVTPNNADNNVSLINLATQAVTNVMGGNNPAPVGVGTTGGAAVAAIVGNTASNTLTVFDLPGGAATTIPGAVGLAPTDMAIDPELHRAYVTMAASNEVAVIDYLAKTLVGKVPTGSRPVHIYMAPVMPTAAAPATPEALSHELWVGNDSGDSVTIFDGVSLRVKATVMTDKGHHKMAFSGAKGYVSNITANNVSVIDRTTLP